MPYFGAHFSISGGLDSAVFDATSIGFHCVQIFSANASRWQNRPITPQAAQRFQSAIKQTGLIMPLIHDSYLINLASPDPELYEKSIAAFSEELRRAALLQIPTVVMHPGASKGDERAVAIDRVAQAFDKIFADLPENKTTVLLETTAGQGSYLGGKFEDLRGIVDASDHPDRFGICFDTCHAFAAGFDLRTREGFDATFDAFDKIVGIERLKAFHLNDSVKGLGEHVDRHAHIGHGALGLEAFRMIVNDERFYDLPMYLETPKGETETGEDWDVVNLRTLRDLIE